MAAGGWGGTTGGAWGTKTTNPTRFDDDDEAPQPTYNAAPASSGFGGAFQPSRPPPQYEASPPAAAFAGSSSTAGGPYDSANKEAQLNQRAAELDAKEKQLKALEAELKASGAVIKKKNWPICYPLLHHDIPGEVPEGSRRVVREIYFCWYGLCAALLYNFFCASTILSTTDSNRIGSWFLSIIYALLGIPLAFWGWYLSIYDAAASNSTLGYMKFFICFSINIGFCVFSAIAPQISTAAWSFAGWLTAFKALGINSFIGIVYVVGASYWTALSVYSIWCMKDAYLFFRGKGGIQQAKQDAALAAFKAGVQQSARQPV